MSDEHILVVDDDEGIRDALVELLEDDHHRVRVASNGREALDLLHAGNRPCLVLLDLMMPVMDGWEFARQKASEPDLSVIPICVITAAGTAGRMPPGAVAVVRKPLRLDRLFAVISEFC